MVDPEPRTFGRVNWRGLASLYRREVLRFLRYAWESIAGPAISSLMFLVVFELALGPAAAVPVGVSLAAFLVPGIVIFSLTHNAFQGAAVSVFHDKIEGMITDVIGAPLTAAEIVAGYALAAASNACVTGAVILALMAVFVDLPLAAPALIVGFAVAAALVFALIGVVVGIWAERWDHYSAAETFLVLPLGLLSGAFFAADRLPPEAHWLFLANPVFHAVEGFRYGFIGSSSESVVVAAAVLVGLIVALGGLAWWMVARGYKLKP